MTKRIRLWLSALIAFIAYSAWTYYANSGMEISQTKLLQTALIQGGLSALITLGFTWLTEILYQRFAQHTVSFAFITPLICLPHHDSPYARQFRKSMNQFLARAATRLNTSTVTAGIFVPFVPMAIQASIIISVHVINHTPNIALTVFPSIIFSGIYGYIYVIALIRADMRKNK